MSEKSVFDNLDNKRPYIDYRDWLANEVIGWRSAEVVEYTVIRWLILAGETTNKNEDDDAAIEEARAILKELFAEPIANANHNGKKRK